MEKRLDRRMAAPSPKSCTTVPFPSVRVVLAVGPVTVIVSSRSTPVAPSQGLPLSPLQKGQLSISTLNLTEPAWILNDSCGVVASFAGPSVMVPASVKRNVSTLKVAAPCTMDSENSTFLHASPPYVASLGPVMVKLSVAKVFLLCLPACGPLVPTFSPAASSSYREFISTRSFLSGRAVPLASVGMRSNLPLCPMIFSSTLPVASAPVRHTVLNVALQAVSTTSPSVQVVHFEHDVGAER
mmetsp:Transcript_97357/g.173405  ORF Transcript_97357/g.173405 Transcript_97357/m.173405 type:complete len:241 (+) Transcript_97357:425-1147(+)